ncbi:hypothetical protein PCL_10507 [Purpureocillium lilacinum]|uniref:RNase H type-1 domain-containing protein n=1 Tax=Purpureocillium lilacinum TaxID=33203 RepID=A0A2U3DQ74_PURLI|nr:hypothetical protein PCL_10507 [Purpureocillium lilacinum]
MAHPLWPAAPHCETEYDTWAVSRNTKLYTMPVKQNRNKLCDENLFSLGKGGLWLSNVVDDFHQLDDPKRALRRRSARFGHGLLGNLNKEASSPTMPRNWGPSEVPNLTFSSRAAFGLLAYLANLNQRNAVLDWLLAISGLSFVFIWASICVCHIRFRQAWAYYGRSLNSIPCRSQVGVRGSYVGLTLCLCILVAQFWVGAFPIGLESMTSRNVAQNFFLKYMGVPIIALFYVSHKLMFKTMHVSVCEMDVDTGRKCFDLSILVGQEKEERAAWPMWKRLYKFLLRSESIGLNRRSGLDRADRTVGYTISLLRIWGDGRRRIPGRPLPAGDRAVQRPDLPQLPGNLPYNTPFPWVAESVPSFHPAYDTYSPVSTWEDIDTRPRVMTYIRRGARLLADQQRPALSRDILWLVVNGVTLSIIPQATTTAADLDQLADAIIDLIQSAARAAGRRSQCRPRKAPWWNEECAASVAELRCIRRAFPLGFNRDVQLARRDLRRMVRRAKRAYWRELIDGVRSDKDVFKITRWLKRPGVFRPPPLQVGETIIETQIGKAEALRHATLERRTADDDISDPWTPSEDTLPIPLVPIEEVQDALLRTGNTSPGPSRPSVFQGGTEIVPGTAMRWLGLWLDRRLSFKFHVDEWSAKARRVANLLKGIANTKHGPLPRAVRRAVKACVETTLFYGAEAWYPGQVAPSVANPNRIVSTQVKHLVLRLDKVLRHAVRAALPVWKTTPIPAMHREAGTPPASIALAAQQIRFSARLKSLDGRHPLVKRASRKPPRARHTRNPSSTRRVKPTFQSRLQRTDQLLPKCHRPTLLPRHYSDIEASPLQTANKAESAGDFLEWLGTAAAATLIVYSDGTPDRGDAFLLKGIANTKHGPLPRAVRRAVKACVETTLFYGAEAWYPGQVAPSVANPNRIVSTQVKHLVLRLDKVLRHAVRAALPVWKTTPIPAMHREAGTPPASIALAAQQIRFSARLKSLDGRHPLVKRASRKPPRARHTRNPSSTRRVKPTFQSRLQRTDQLLPKCHRPALLPRHYSDTEASPLQTANKAETAGDFLEWLGTAAAATLIVYSDGSQLPNGAVGFGFAVHRDKQSLVQGSGRMGPSEVFDAEAAGALEGLRAALRLGDTRSAVVVCTDNLAVASCLRGNPADSSQDKFTKFQELVTSHGNVQVRWIPGHTNIPGNEEADGLAKAGCLQPEPPEAMPSLAHLRRLARQQPRDAFKAWWSTEAPESYKTLNLEATTCCPPELALPRATLHSLLAARSRHGDFADYHERFNHDVTATQRRMQLNIPRTGARLRRKSALSR